MKRRVGFLLKLMMAQTFFSVRNARVRLLFNTVACSILLFMSCTTVWNLCVILRSSSLLGSGVDERDVLDGSSWKPPLHMLQNGQLDLGELLSMYRKQCVLPWKGVTVAIFSSDSPLPDASHLKDPRFVMARQQREDLLVAAFHSVVTRVIWIYPLWQRTQMKQFHEVHRYRIGLAIIDLSASERFAQSIEYTPLTNSTWGNASTICLCSWKESDRCSLPLISATQQTIPRKSCNMISSIIYEQVIDVLAESFLADAHISQSTSTRSPPPPQQQHGLHCWMHPPIDRRVSGDSSAAAHLSSDTTPTPWLTYGETGMNRYESIPVVTVIDASYFGASRTREHKIDSEDFERMMKPVLEAVPPTGPSLRKVNQYLDTILLAASMRPYPNRDEWIFSRPPLCPSKSQLSLAWSKSRAAASEMPWAAAINANHSAQCADSETLVLSIIASMTSSLPNTVSTDIVGQLMQLWHWLCNADPSLFLAVAGKSICGSNSTTHPHDYNLCDRPSLNALFPSYHVTSGERKLMMIRLGAIFNHLPTPRFIALVGYEHKPDVVINELLTIFGRTF